MPAFTIDDQRPLLTIERGPKSRSLGAVFRPDPALIDQTGPGVVPRDDLRVGCLLIIVENILTASRADRARGVQIEGPARHVQRVDTVVAQFAGAPMPEPVPVVVKVVFDERAIGCGSLPERVV